MPLTNDQKEKISLEVIKVLVTRYDSFPKDASNNRNAPFHEAFLNAFSDKLNEKVSDIPFFISLNSWFQGLNTTIGQTFFENVAHHLSNGEKREYTSKKLGNIKINETQKNNIADRITALSNGGEEVHPCLQYENSLIFISDNSKLTNSIDFSADVFIEKRDTIIAIELKSVKPNSGEMRGEKQKILEGKAALYRLFPDKKIEFYIGFPFDPTVNPTNEAITGFDKKRFLDSIINMNKYFDSNETLVASELWDFLSGQSNTMEEILNIINSISTSSFWSDFQFLCNNSNRNSSNYEQKLLEWNLFLEKKLLNHENTIRKRIKGDKKLEKIFNKNIFDDKGSYNSERYYKLNGLID